MAHVYGDQDTFRRWLSGGSADRDPEMLTVLEASSRAVDAFCARGSGFGPVHETRSYSTTRSTLHLGGDLAVLTTFTVNGTEIVAPPEVTGGYIRRITGYTGEIEVEGDWTYPYQLVTVGALETGGMTDDAETVDFATAPAVSVGMTLLVDEEQMLLTDITVGESATTLTVVRAANGTAAAAHSAAAPIRSFRYDRAAVDTTYRVAARRWRQRDAGLTGMFGGGDVPVTSNQDTEWSILLSGCSHLRFLAVY